MTEVRGLCLYSTATQIPGGTALASSYDTSWKSEDSTGPSDNWPVLAQRGLPTSKQGALFDNTVTFLPTALRCGTRTLLACQRALGACPGVCTLRSHGSYKTILAQEAKSGNGC